MTITSLTALTPAFLRAIGSVLPLLIQRIPSASTFANIAEEVLSAGAALIERGEEASHQLADLTRQIEAMGVSEPTEDQWAQLKLSSDIAHAQIQLPLD